MNTLTKRIALLIAGTLLTGTGLMAQQGRINKRQAKQQERIAAGAATGKLTPKETAKLEAGQAKVQAAETAARADGKVTAKEHAKIEHMQDKQSKRIHKQKHDKQHN
ncbi:MAG: hypothetical protein IPL96_13680 [Holophagaceae bacterium]|nr:hypothetical protein [Holophagaceae bacterium]